MDKNSSSDFTMLFLKQSSDAEKEGAVDRAASQETPGQPKSPKLFSGTQFSAFLPAPEHNAGER